MKITISEEFKKIFPDFAGCALTATVKNSEPDDNLWNEISLLSDNYRQVLTDESIKQMPPIHATREAYKKFGKAPSRYRPAAEALLRRIVKGRSYTKLIHLPTSLTLQVSTQDTVSADLI